jgi:hypothetical protein
LGKKFYFPLFLVLFLGFFAFFGHVNGSTPNNLGNDLLVAMDVDTNYLVVGSLKSSEVGCAVVNGKIGFLESIRGDNFLVMSNGEARPNIFPDGWRGEKNDTLSVSNNNPYGTCPLGGSAYDIATLNFSLRAPEWANSLSFNFRFMSEEYPDYVGQEFNDFFSCLLNGENIVFDTEGNIINVNNNFFDPTIIPEGTVFNAATVMLTAKSPITGGTTINLNFIIGDVADDILDSAVFLDNFRFSGDEVSRSVTVPSYFESRGSMREARSLSVVGVVGVSVVAVTAFLAALGPSVNAAIMNLPIPSQLRSFLKFYGASLFQKVDKVKLEALKKAAFISKEELLSLGISVLVVTIVYSFVETNGLQQFLNPSILAVVIPSTFVSVCIVSFTKVFSDAFCAKTCGAYRKFSLWITGFLTFIMSGILFLFPFSSPGITRYQCIEISKRNKGLIVLSRTLILLTLTFPFGILFLLGFKIIGDTGVLLTLMSACYSLVPLKYLSGKAVFDYNKKYSLASFLITAVLFISFTINLFPVIAYLPVGVISGFLALIVYRQLKISK